MAYASKVSRDVGNYTCQYIVISAQGSACAIESRDISLYIVRFAPSNLYLRHHDSRFERVSGELGTVSESFRCGYPV